MEVAPQLDLKLLYFLERNLFGSDQSKKNAVKMFYWTIGVGWGAMSKICDGVDS